MQLQPTKWKVIISLIPFYALFFLIPVLPMLTDVPLFLYGDFLNTSFGNFFIGLGLAVYLIFTVLLFPFGHLFKVFGLTENNIPPEISPLGLFLLALIYSGILYLSISLFQKKRIR